MPPRRSPWVLAILLIVQAGCGQAGPGTPGDTDRRAAEPRIVTLSPHLAELVYAAGGGAHLVGVSAYSNFPDAVRRLPQVGDAFSIDHEQLTLLAPDIVLAWESGTPRHTVDELRDLGFRIEVLRTRNLADVADALRTIGALTSSNETAAEAADQFVAELSALRQANEGAEPIRVFYQVSAQPLYTVSGAHYVSELVELCGGENIFAELNELAPAVSAEAVLVRDPELLLAGRAAETASPFAQWQRWPDMAANRYANRFYVDADALGRAGPRLAEAGAAICQSLEAGRLNRARVARGA